MTEIRMKIAASSRAARSDLSSQASFSMDTSPFLNWNEENLESEEEKAIVFRSLVATLKLQHVLDVSLEAKAVRFLKSVDRQQTASANAFLSSLISICDDSPTDFKHYIVVLISSTSQAIIKASVEMLERLILWCSAQVRLTLVKADLIPHLINTLNMQALSFTESVDIHINVIKIIRRFLWLATAGAQADLEIEDDDEQQAVQKTIFRQVLVPSEQYLCHLCVNQFLFVDEDQSKFLDLIAQLLEISPYYQPTMEVVLNMPVLLTIPSSLTFFENEATLWSFLYDMVDIQRRWTKTRGDVRQMWKTVHRMLRMEGIEDVIEEKLRNDRNGHCGGWIVARSIILNNLQGMNIPKPK